MNLLSILDPQASQVPAHLAPRVVQTVVDVRATSVPYHTDGTKNALAQAYRVAMVTSILDDTMRPVPFDSLEFRIVVPKYLAFEYPLDQTMEALNDVAYARVDLMHYERARVAAKEAQEDELFVFPTTRVSKTEYDDASLAQGLSPEDAAEVIFSYLNRFHGGNIVVTQNVSLVDSMLTRIGMPLVVVPYVYHRIVDMYGFLTGFMFGRAVEAQDPTLAPPGVPGIEDLVAFPEDDQQRSLAKNPLVRATAIADFLRTIQGQGDATILDAPPVEEPPAPEGE
jgi:hypothetical protein